MQLSNLPNDLTLSVLLYTGKTDVVNTRQVNKSIYNKLNTSLAH